MELSDSQVDLITVPGWLAEMWLNSESGTVVGEITSDNKFHSFMEKNDKATPAASSSRPGTAPRPGTPQGNLPQLFDQVVLRKAVNTFTCESLDSTTPNSQPPTKRRKVDKVRNVVNLRPTSSTDAGYQRLLAERKAKIREGDRKIELVEERPQEKVTTHRGDQMGGTGKRRRT